MAFLAGRAAAVHWTEEPAESEMQGAWEKTQLGTPVEAAADVSVGACFRNQGSQRMLAADAVAVDDVEEVAVVVVTAVVAVVDSCSRLQLVQF